MQNLLTEQVLLTDQQLFISKQPFSCPHLYSPLTILSLPLSSSPHCELLLSNHSLLISNLSHPYPRREAKHIHKRSEGTALQNIQYRHEIQATMWENQDILLRPLHICTPYVANHSIITPRKPGLYRSLVLHHLFLKRFS